MDGKLTCQQQPKDQEYIFSANYFTLIPQEIIRLIMWRLGSLNCRQLSMTSQLLQKFFTYYPVPCISNKTMLDPQLAHLCIMHNVRESSPQLACIPKLLMLKNSEQLVEYKKAMDPLHDKCLIIDFSEDLPSLDIPFDISGFPSIFINWSNDYKSPEHAIKHSFGEFKKFFQLGKYTNVEKLVLNNLVCSYGFMHSLTGTFDGLKSLKIASYSAQSKFDTTLSKFTTINELEIMSPTSAGFGNKLRFTLPIQLEKITFNTLKHNSEPVSRTHKSLEITTLQGTSLTTINVNNNVYGESNIHDALFIDITPCTENLILNTNEWKSIFCCSQSDYSHLKIIHVSQYILRQYKIEYFDRYIANHFSDYIVLPFLILSPDGELSLDYNMVPECIEFGVFGKDGKLRIIWKKQ